jgi:hypothetical protein
VGDLQIMGPQMTQPDRWDEIAFGFVKQARTFPVFQDELAQALRDAEKAGMERAAVIAQERWMDGVPIAEIPNAIRAAKETKE